MSELTQAVRMLAGVHGMDNVRIFDAEVITVNESERTCDVYMVGGNSSNTLTVRLMAAIDDGKYIIPSVNSTVIVTMSDYVEPFISMFSEVEKIVWLGGEYEGVPIVKHPTNDNKGVLARLNALENDINSLKDIFGSGWTVAPTDGGGALKLASAIWSSQPITLTTQSDIEHPSITH